MLIVSFICFVVLIGLALLGESTLGLFQGDRELASQATKASFALLAGLAFAFAQPAIWRWFAGVLQRMIAAGGSQSGVAKFVLRPDFKQMLGQAGMALFVVFAIATCTLAWYLWKTKA